MNIFDELCCKYVKMVPNNYHIPENIIKQDYTKIQKNLDDIYNSHNINILTKNENNDNYYEFDYDGQIKYV